MPSSYDRLPAIASVLDASQGITGPSAAMLLRQYGADVIKVEPQDGDWSRIMGIGNDGMTSLSVASNLGKRGIALDLKKPAGAEIFRRLAERADVMIESFRTGVIERLGFGIDQKSIGSAPRPSRASFSRTRRCSKLWGPA